MSYILPKCIHTPPPPSYGTRHRDDTTLPKQAASHSTMHISRYRWVLSLSILLFEARETTFKILNRTVWTQNKAYKAEAALCGQRFRCEEVETLEHLPHSCNSYTHHKYGTWRALSTAIARNSGDDIPAIVLVNNKPNPSILRHVKHPPPPILGKSANVSKGKRKRHHFLTCQLVGLSDQSGNILAVQLVCCSWFLNFHPCNNIKGSSFSRALDTWPSH